MKRISLLATMFLFVILLSGCEPLYKEVDSVWANDHQVDALQEQIDTMYTQEQVDEMLSDYMLINEYNDNISDIETFIDYLQEYIEIQERINASYIKALEERLYVIENKDKLASTMDFTQQEYYNMITLENGNTREITITYQRGYVGGMVGEQFAVLSIEYCTDVCTVDNNRQMLTMDEILNLADEWLEQE